VLTVPLTGRLYLCVVPIDMRRSFDGLAEMARKFIGQDPMSGDLFVFRNKEESKVKILFWDRDGYVIYYKRLEKGTFKIPGGVDAGVEIDATAFMMLMHGIDAKEVRKQRRYIPAPIREEKALVSV
jgi:transposase